MLNKSKSGLVMPRASVNRLTPSQHADLNKIRRELESFNFTQNKNDSSRKRKQFNDENSNAMTLKKQKISVNVRSDKQTKPFARHDVGRVLSSSNNHNRTSSVTQRLTDKDQNHSKKNFVDSNDNDENSDLCGNNGTTKYFVNSKNIKTQKKPIILSNTKDKIQELNEENSNLGNVIEDLKQQLLELNNDTQQKEHRYLSEISELQDKKLSLNNMLNNERQNQLMLTQQVTLLQSTIQSKDSQIQILDESQRSSTQQINTLQTTISLKDCMLNNYKSEIDMLKSQMSTLQAQCESQASHINNDNIQIQTLKNQNNTLEQTINMNNAILMNSRNEISALKFNVQSLETTCQSQSDVINAKNKKIEELEACIQKLNTTIEKLEHRSRKDEEVRKNLHNHIQELKGNIRVYCRVRPSTIEEEKESIFVFNDNDIDHRSIDLVSHDSTNSLGKIVDGKTYSFEFDHVFRPWDKQETVFSEISQLVQSALDGYKVCIFAYGQTGSGKTYTMEGPSNNPNDNNRGMIPRAVEQIFLHSQSLVNKGWKYECKVTFLEIYNEKIRDLLSNHDDYDEDNMKCLELQQRNPKNPNEVEIPGLTERIVTCANDVFPLLAIASHNRSVGKTDCNERSSRSHSVFQLFLHGTNSVTQHTVDGVLNLIDLAGSERLKKSHSQGQQLKETQSINYSLSCLGDVIAALAKQSKHIPYRNSKLTHLLSNYFGGDAKTLMFVNLCSENDKFDESLCSLRFGAKVNDCQIGIARRNIVI